MNGKEVKGLHIRCDVDGEKKVLQKEGDEEEKWGYCRWDKIISIVKKDFLRAAFVGNLPYDIEEEEVRAAFS